MMMEQASNAAPEVGIRRDSVSREERNLASNGDGAGSRKRPRLDPDDGAHPRNHHGTRSITAAAAAATSETTAADMLEDEWKRFARQCTENMEEQVMHRIKEEVRREKRKMEATPEWDRAIAEVQQLEHRFHKLWLQWARDEEARRIDEAYRARRNFFTGHRTPPPATIPHGEKRGEEDRRRSDRELRPMHRSELLPDEGERRRSRDRGTSRTRAREQSEPSAKRPRSRSRSRSRGRRIKEESPDEEMHLERREQRSLQQRQDQQRQRRTEEEEEEEEERERRVARELHEQKQREQEEEAEMDEVEQAFPDSGSLPPPQRAARFRHHCEMCQVTLNSQKQMFEHFRGKKHVQGEERLRKMSGQGPSPATYPPSGQALNWQNQRDWRADDEMNWEREKARGWSKLPTPLPAIVKPEPRDEAGDGRAHEVSTGTELVQQPTCSVAVKQVLRDGGQAAKEAERERPAWLELDLNVVSDDEEAEIQQEEAAPRPTPEKLGSPKVVNLFGMVFTDDDDDDESSGEDREDDSESSGSGGEGDFDEDSDEDHGEEPEAEGKEEVDDEGEETERYWYTDDEEDEQQEEERRAEGARVEPESAKEERRRRAGGAPDVAEATKASTTSSQPRKPAFLLSPAQRRENWEAKYALVKAWFDEHGRLPSKAKSKTLHNWLHYNKKSWSPLDPSQRNRLRALGVKPFRRRRCKETPSPSSRAKEEVEPEPLRDGLPKRRVRTGGDTAIWEGQLRKLERFRAATDGQNPPYFLSTGKWLYEQIALQNRGLLSSSRKSRLESLGIKWDWKDEFANKSGCEKAKKWKQRAERTQDSSDTEEKKGSAKTKERENERREGKEKKRETKKKAKKEKTTIKKRRAEEEKAKKNNPKKRLKREVKEKEGHTKVPWEVRYEELCQYLAAHDQHLPGKQTTLGKWVYTQQYRINKGLQAQEDKIAKLVALGITLSPPKTPTTPTTTTTTTTTTTPTTISAAALPEPEQKHLQDHGGATEEDERKVSATMEELLQRIKEEKL